MTQEQEKQLLQAIYDRLYDAITYQPGGGKNPFTDDETFIHFCKNAAINPDSFDDPRTPSNPLGSFTASEEFARMVDKVSPLSLEWENTNDSLSFAYKSIVNSANATTEPDEKAKEMYEKAYNYLHPEVTTKNPFTGEEVTERTDSPDYIAYEANMSDYIVATQAYRIAYNQYLDDLSDKDPEIKKRAERDWQAKAPLLENNIKSSFRKLEAGNAKYVEQALSILETTINDGIRQALSSAMEAVRDDHHFSSSLGFPDKWLFSYPVPSDWTKDGCKGFTELNIKGSQTDIHNESTVHKFSVDSSFQYGLWRVKVGSSGDFEHSSSSSDKNSIEIQAKIAKVSIERPWFMESIFRLSNWSTDVAKGEGQISNGKIDSTNRGHVIPMYPVAFIVAKDIVIKANFSHEDEEHIKQSMQANTSVGWGPFSISGSYSYGHSSDNFHSDYEDGEIRIPGMQIIGWVSRVIPYSTK